MQASNPDWRLQREGMVREQLIPRGIVDARVLDVMGSVPRHLFVPEELQLESHADHPVSIGRGQTISQPYIVALMSEWLRLDGTERVLEIGAGCGYQTAVLAGLASSVCALELDEHLVEVARRNLAACGVGGVDLRCGSGFAPWPEGGCFEGIVCACAPLSLPVALLRQLGPGGRLVVPIGVEGEIQTLFCYLRRPDGTVEEEHRLPVRFVPMRQSRSLS